jgi:hypothetical protein
LDQPVGEGLSTRVRVEESYTDPVGYFVKDGELVWTRTLGRPFNQVTLPAGWMLKSVNTPAIIGTDDEGRVTLRFTNIRTDQLTVTITAKKRSGPTAQADPSGAKLRALTLSLLTGVQVTPPSLERSVPVVPAAMISRRFGA